MSILHERLLALTRRLQSISQLSTDQDDIIELGDLDVDPTKSKYICAECAWTTSTNAGALARHTTLNHPSRLKCPDCKSLCEDQEELEKHRSQKHGHLCSGCQRFFATVNECEHHKSCERKHHILTKSKSDTSSHTRIDQVIGGNSPGRVQSFHNRKGSVQSGCCPGPGCPLTFLDFDTLYEHYVELHPLSVVDHGQSKPFKCPFCPKRYQHDRFIPGHVRTHKPKSLSVAGIGDAEDQEALIRQSHVALANRESQSRAEAQGRANHTSSDEEGESSMPIKEEEDLSPLLEDGAVYINEGVELEHPTAGHSDQTDLQEFQDPGETVPVGLVLNACPADLPRSHFANERSSVKITPETPTTKLELSDPMDLDDDYPDRFALDDDELPSTMSYPDSSIIAVQLSNDIFHQSLSHKIIRALKMQHFVNVNEVVDIFTYFLDEHQRLYVLKQLGSINLNQHDSDISIALHGTVFKTLIDAWVDFKRLAIRFAPQLIRQANKQRIGFGMSVTWALVQYCLNLESIIYRNAINIAHHFLRDPPLDNHVFTVHAPFPHLIAALADRVKNRTVHDPSIVFTNEMVLRGTRDYVKILQMIFRPLYPINAGHERLWRELRLL